MEAIVQKSWKNHYPFTSNFMEVAGYKLHYLDEGRGDPIVLVHGNPTWSFYYRNLISILKQNHRVIAVDNLGCGLSEKPQDFRYNLANHIDNLQLLLDKLDIKDYRMVVHDWGGAIGFGLATREPERVRGVVILNTAAFHINRIPWQINLCKLPILGPFIVKYLNAFAWPATFMATSKGLSSTVKAGYLYPYDGPRNRKAISDFVQDIPMKKDHPTFEVLKNIEERLPLLKCPKLILWGGADFCFNDLFFERWREIYPEAEVTYFPKAGHYVLEDESENVINRVQNFFREDLGERSLSNLN